MSGSETFSNVVRSLTNNTEEDTPVRRLFCRILLKSLNEHDISRTEAFKIFSPNDFVLFSRKFRSVNTLGTRLVRTGEQCEETTRAVRDNWADLYWNRDSNVDYQQFKSDWEGGLIHFPTTPANISLYKFVSCFNKNWTLSTHLYVPHPTPSFLYPPKKNNKELRKIYVETVLLLHKPGTTRHTLLDDVETELAEFIENEVCPFMVRYEYLKSLEEDNTEDDNEDDLLPSPVDRAPPEIEQDDFMVAMGGRILQANINSQTDVNDDNLQQDIDDENYLDLTSNLDYDWLTDSRNLGMNDKTIKEDEDWINRKKLEYNIEDDWDTEYSRETLNTKQKDVFDEFQYVVDNYLSENNSTPGKLIDVSGYGGTGKTRLINTIMQVC